MSLSRSPSPLPNGGWTSKSHAARSSTPNGLYAGVNGYTNGDNQWAAAKARSAQVRGYPSIQTKNEGFFQRSKRRISTLPVFNSPYTPLSANWKDPEKLGRSRWTPRGGSSVSKLKTFVGNVLRKFKFFLIILSIVTLTTLLMSQISMCFLCLSVSLPFTDYQQIYEVVIGATPDLVVAVNSSSFSEPMKVVVLWNGKAPENGPLRGTASRTRNVMQTVGAIISRSPI